ncbi:Winged helix-turn-helix DNA-binding [Halogranum rubrum]|uniref:Winged helix-turn-helix DNA-binding n=1 Tax=Halogranum rubrum TaxID=553466 RepID=A0A1I4C1I6_9EURY|nr:winged helix-turn-helix transcriptional regulator [Halogranum rubrum]SFK74267.1 Winged helix-turn-helix DNA-binding [Halogranum rubrum]
MVQTEQSSVSRLVELLDGRLKQSEWEILTTLAAADGPLTIDELAEETGYTERTVKKRVGTLEDQLHGGTLLRRDDDDNPVLHPQFARAVRSYSS